MSKEKNENDSSVKVSAFVETNTGDGLDFNEMEKLETEGSICDTYRLERNNNLFFVKRLKEEYRDKPLYQEALRKEYEIGSRLKHPALPYYEEHGNDYLLLDYIKGRTLASMIEKKDPVLKSKKFVEKLLTTLLDVLGYLHTHNIVHCDVKADNIIVAEHTGNIILIDLDKCYTDSRCGTVGDPTVYGMGKDDIGKTDIDYRGIGIILESLRKQRFITSRKLRRVEKFCFRRGVSGEDIYDALTHSQAGWIWWMGAVIIAFLAMLAFIDLWKSPEKEPLQANEETTGNQQVEEKGIEIGEEKVANKESGIVAEEKATETIINVEPVKEDNKIGNIIEPEKGNEREKKALKEKPDEIGRTVANCYSDLIPLLMSSQAMIERPKTEYRSAIVRNIGLIEKSLKEDKERAVEKLRQKMPETKETEIIKKIEGTKEYIKITSEAKKTLEGLRKALEDLE